jgi:hypothetical protein
MRRHAYGYIGEVLKLLEITGGRVIGRVWIKGIGKPFNGTAIYAASIQSIYTAFQDYLNRYEDRGVVIVDSRLKHLNTPVAHSIFTQKFKVGGDAYDRIVELPAFSHSDNHAGLQVADTIASAVVTPIAIQTYCVGHVTNVHVRPRYSDIKATFKNRCASLQHPFTGPNGKPQHGFVVSDGLAGRPSGLLFG